MRFNPLFSGCSNSILTLYAICILPLAFASHSTNQFLDTTCPATNYPRVTLSFRDEYIIASAAVTIDPTTSTLLLLHDTASSTYQFPLAVTRTYEPTRFAARRAVKEAAGIYVPFMSLYPWPGSQMAERDGVAVMSHYDAKIDKIVKVHWFVMTASSKAVYKVKSTRVSRRDDRKVEWLGFEDALSKITSKAERKVVERVVELWRKSVKEQKEGVPAKPPRPKRTVMDQIAKCGMLPFCEGRSARCPKALEWVKCCEESVEQENEKANDV